MKALICYTQSGSGHTHVEKTGDIVNYQIKDGFFIVSVDTDRYLYRVDLVRHFEITSV